MVWLIFDLGLILKYYVAMLQNSRVSVYAYFQVRHCKVNFNLLYLLYQAASAGLYKFLSTFLQSVEVLLAKFGTSETQQGLEQR